MFNLRLFLAKCHDHMALEIVELLIGMIANQLGNATVSSAIGSS